MLKLSKGIKKKKKKKRSERFKVKICAWLRFDRLFKYCKFIFKLNN